MKPWFVSPVVTRLSCTFSKFGIGVRGTTAATVVKLFCGSFFARFTMSSGWDPSPAVEEAVGKLWNIWAPDEKWRLCHGKIWGKIIHSMGVWMGTSTLWMEVYRWETHRTNWWIFQQATFDARWDPRKVKASCGQGSQHVSNKLLTLQPMWIGDWWYMVSPLS